MDAKLQMRVASLLTLLLGIWVVISPVFISVTGAGLYSTIITGAALGVLSLVQLFWHNSLPSWINGLAGVWLVVSAFVLTVSTAMTWSLIVAGVLAIILATWDGNEVEQVYHPARV